MQRRSFLTATAAAGLAPAAQSEPPANAWFHLLWFYMRNGTQVQRTTDYLRDVWLPATKRNGIGPVGFFSPVFGERAPYILSLASYPSFAAIETAHGKIHADQEFQKGWDAYNAPAEPPYIRMEGELLRAFDGMPALDVPPGDRTRPARTFELRTYESKDEKAGNRKVKMFNDGEIAIFRKAGMTTVFFGQAALVGRNLPHLTYMLAYDDMAAHDKTWRAFGSDPDWQKLRSQPGLSDAEIVSNINNTILRPLPFSPIR
jgi:hypothetical protein